MTTINYCSNYLIYYICSIDNIQDLSIYVLINKYCFLLNIGLRQIMYPYEKYKNKNALALYVYFYVCIYSKIDLQTSFPPEI